MGPWARLDVPLSGVSTFGFPCLHMAPGSPDPLYPHRETVDLLFFPTGGGKTEAYLGLAAFTMVLRRLRNPGQNGVQSAGVSIIMRYTLRLLTLDQLARASGLVCALELERVADAARYGEWPFEIGLWVGKAATPNLMGHKGEKRSDSARAKTRRFRTNPRGNPSPIPLENCPWCGTRFEPDSFALLPDDDRPKELRVVCANFECDFSGDRPLPILAVDESIYRRLPAFLIATADKFAALPWVAETGKLLGGAQRFDRTGFHGPSERGGGQRLDRPLPPPDLVIQDELHLISGPLGTMVGLYEAAIEALCAREMDGRKVRPKIVASTATVRHAQNQIQALFARSMTQIFPPPGPDRRDSFFARSVPVEKTAGRLYLGITSPGRNPKVLMRKVWLALMGAAERAYRDAGGHRNEKNPADPYMTVLGYFNSLRELGGARRILEEEVQNTVKQYGSRKRIGERRGLFQDRRTFSEVVELTSRVSTNQVADARRRLERPFNEPQRVDCAIATNMISVGLDIPRLGLMVVLSQPKTHAEYIQATSRVGRDDRRPGLVVTLLNAQWKGAGSTAPPVTAARSSPRPRARCATTTSTGPWSSRCSGSTVPPSSRRRHDRRPGEPPAAPAQAAGRRSGYRTHLDLLDPGDGAFRSRAARRRRKSPRGSECAGTNGGHGASGCGLVACRGAGSRPVTESGPGVVRSGGPGTACPGHAAGVRRVAGLG